MPYINLKQRKQPRQPTISKKEAQDIYNTTRWQRLRTWYIRNNPLCEDCLAKDPEVVTAAAEVHHKTAFMGVQDLQARKALAYDPDNLRSLCIPCHKDRH